MVRENRIKRIFDLYTSDLSINEIERLIKRESAEVYEFFAADIKIPQNKNKIVRTLIFIRNLFNAFLLKMPAARRIFYLVSLLFFIAGYAQGITSYQVLSFLIINVLLAFELADNLLVKDDLGVAKKIQSKLLPETNTEVDNYEVCSYYESAREVGGDYYDFIKPNGSGRDVFVIGDISGKGLAASLYMVRVQTIIHALVERESSAGGLLTELNRSFSKNLNPGYFLTLSGAFIEQDGKMRLFNAGHPPALYYSMEKGTFAEINPKGIGIGLSSNGLFGKNLEERELDPGKGDILLFYTDGLTELMNERNIEFGIEQVKSIIKRNSDKSLNEIKEKIKNSLDAFCGYSGRNDDITMVMFRKK